MRTACAPDTENVRNPSSPDVFLFLISAGQLSRISPICFWTAAGSERRTDASHFPTNLQDHLADQDQIDVPKKSACDTIEQFASKLRVFKQCLVVVPDGSQPKAIVCERIHVLFRDSRINHAHGGPPNRLGCTAL